jgi:hypothetical protein
VVFAGLLALAYLAAKAFYEKRPSSGVKAPEVAQTNPMDADNLALVRSLLESRDPSRIPETQDALTALAMEPIEVGAAASRSSAQRTRSPQGRDGAPSPSDLRGNAAFASPALGNKRKRPIPPLGHKASPHGIL